MSIWSALMGMLNGRSITVSETLPTFDTETQTIYVKRQKLTSDGIFGSLTCSYGTFACKTVENLDHEMRPGRYAVTFDVSPHLGYLTPHIQDPERDQAAGGDAGLRIHEANRPNQLDGCIALGRVVDGDAVDYSDPTFQEFMLLTDKAKPTWLEISEDFQHVGNA